MTLPVEDALPQLLAALRAGPNAVLVAPPGAGKTTVVPLALRNEDWAKDGTVIVLEPRRLAARAAASRMAHLLGERVGETVGYRVRFDTKVGPKTRVEVVTDGVFTRRLARDPGLEGVVAVIFDEFHERSLDGDLALALCLDLQAALRDDLRLLPMSATLDAAGVGALLDAPVIESEGRAFPVTLDHDPRPPDVAVEAHTARAVLRELGKPGGDILVFLPGQREIERTAERLTMPEGTVLHRLYGVIDRAAQDAAIAPDPNNRKVVLASAIAETSLTIEGVDLVIDSGLARRPQFEPATGLTRLATVRATRAAATQRAGRAGRLGPGRCLRLWHEGQTAALPAFDPPEIEVSDLSSLLLDLTDWGVTDPSTLRWMTPPPAPALAEARTLLERLGILGEDGRLSAFGRTARAIALPPRLAAMVALAEDPARAALLALVLQERGAGGTGTDVAARLDRVARGSDKRSKTLRDHAARMAKGVPPGPAGDTGERLSMAFPDRIARRGGQAPDGTIRYRLASGRGAQLDATDALAREEWLVVADLIGRAGAARIVAAAAITKAQIVALHGGAIEQVTQTAFDVATGRLSAHRTTRLGALTLDAPRPLAIDDTIAEQALLAAVREHGLDLLPWRDATRSLRARLAFLHRQGVADIPAMSDAALLESLDEWLAPFLPGKRAFAGIALHDALMMRAGHPPQSLLDEHAPVRFVSPAGNAHPIDYSGEVPVIALRPQELFGLDAHPQAGNVPVELHLTSPAGRPIQITRDLPGFWRGSWSDVRSDLRGRYPKHPWPKNPLSAEPTARVKHPRKR